VRDHALGGIFHRHDTVVCAVFANLGENVRDGFLRRVSQARTKTTNRGLMRERGFRPEIRDGQSLFQRQRARHDFAINGAQLVIRHRPLVMVADARQHRAFAMWHIDFLARLEFDFTDGEDVARAVVE
jgi:hypothetical protein